MGVAPKYLRDAIWLPTSASSLHPLCFLDRRELFVPRTRTTMNKSRSFSLLALPFGISFHLQVVLLSYRPTFLCPYHFLKLLFSWRISNQKRLCWPTAVEGRYINTWIQYNTIWVYNIRIVPKTWYLTGAIFDWSLVVTTSSYSLCCIPFYSIF